MDASHGPCPPVPSAQELERLTAAVSHDLKEPLRGIRNYAQFLLEDIGPALDEDAREQLQMLGWLGARAEGLVTALVTHTRLGQRPFDLRPLDLGGELGRVLESLRPAIEQSGARIERPAALPVLPCDAAAVHLILFHLIDNALRYHEPGAVPEIGIDCDPAGPSIRIRDNGIGIEPRYFGRIFEHGQRLHPREAFGGGNGLGLTTARRAVERHGGQLWLDSVPGQGSTFCFTLGPADRGPATRAMPPTLEAKT